MRRFVILFALACGSIAFAQQPPPRDRPAAAIGTASIRGRVTDSGGRPLARVEIRAGGSTTPVQANGLTDASGRFDLNDLPAGTYTVVATKPNYVRTAWGEQRAEGPGKRITIADGQRLENINLRMMRAGAIAGRIVDEFGDPAADVSVMAMRYQYVQGSRRLMPTGRGGTTNDLGDFRVYGLSPGQYYLSATLRSGSLMNADTADRSGYAPTFYPGTGSVADAQRLGIAPGQTIVGVNLTLLPIRTATVSGAAFDSDMKPIGGGMVVIAPRSSATGPMTMAFPLKADGRFTISGVTPGEYVLRVMNTTGSDTAVADVAVNGADVSDVQLVASRPSTIRGRVVFTASATTATPPNPSSIDMGAVREWMISQPVRSPARVKDDGTFEISLMAGHVVLRVAPIPAGQGGPWRLGRVMLQGVDVGDAGIDVPPNGAIDNVVVEMTNQTYEVTGRVTDADGNLVRDCFVIVFAQDPSRWTVQTRYVGVGRPAADDVYHVRVLPGDYYVVAMSEVEPNAWTDAEFLSLARERATKITIADDKKTLDLPLSPAPVF